MSRILHLVNMGLRYGRSKGVREHRQEDPPLGILAAPCHLEESASHHDPRIDQGTSREHQGTTRDDLECSWMYLGGFQKIEKS